MKENSKITTIDEIFRWKLGSAQCKRLSIDPVVHRSVEEINKETSKRIGWTDYNDVLYSFLLTYKLGLEIISEDDFNRCAGEYIKEYKEKFKSCNLNTNSTRFLYYCSKDDAFKSLNGRKEYEDFIKLYFSIGNLIPVWPGGNEARGKMGVYDMPEIFFGKYIEYTKVLAKQYKETKLDEIINANGWIVCRREKDGLKIRISEKEAEFGSIKELKDEMKKDNELYYYYLRHRNKVIEKRKEKIEQYLSSIKDSK